MAKVKEGEWGYKLYDTLKDIQSKGVGKEINIALQIGEINPSGDNAIVQILQILDKSFKR